MESLLELVQLSQPRYWEIPLYPVMAVNLAGNTNTTCWNSEVGIALSSVLPQSSH